MSLSVSAKQQFTIQNTTHVEISAPYSRCTALKCMIWNTVPDCLHTVCLCVSCNTQSVIYCGVFLYYMCIFLVAVFPPCVFLCVSWFNFGWPSPLALWPLWPFGSGCGPSICLLLSRSGGTGCNGRPPGSLTNLPLTRPPASCSGPQICTALPGGPQDTQLDPFV